MNDLPQVKNERPKNFCRRKLGKGKKKSLICFVDSPSANEERDKYRYRTFKAITEILIFYRCVFHFTLENSRSSQEIAFESQSLT
mmetsp:Transcript_9155/g.9937  ORF Transcript_9155/g.9937 Transcript_9155/m.9937 type:complete len:85 (+) Transcript_9155:351-605(+)